MNPRQRRGVLLLGLAVLVAIGVFAAVASYVSGVRKQVTPKTTVVVLRQNVTALQVITPAMVKRISIPKKWAPQLALHDPVAIGGRVAPVDLKAGTVLQDGSLEAPPELAPGQRELAIEVSADTGVAGKINNGSIVDIEATYASDQRSAARSQVVVGRARIITVGQPRQASRRFPQGNQSGGSGATQNQQVVPVTFALSPRDTLKVTYAESFATQVRLALVRQGDSSSVPRKRREYSLPPARAQAPQ